MCMYCTVLRMKPAAAFSKLLWKICQSCAFCEGRARSTSGPQTMQNSKELERRRKIMRLCQKKGKEPLPPLEGRALPATTVIAMQLSNLLSGCLHLQIRNNRATDNEPWARSPVLACRRRRRRSFPSHRGSPWSMLMLQKRAVQKP